MPRWGYLYPEEAESLAEVPLQRVRGLEYITEADVSGLPGIWLDRPLPEFLRDLFRERGWTLGVAESLTGGLLAAYIVDAPGASHYFRGGIVAYQWEAKAALLGVDLDFLRAAGAVNLEVAQRMAMGARKRLAVDWAVSLTGVAGPEPGTHGEPVGQVFCGIAGPGKTTAREVIFSGERQEIRWCAVHFGLRSLMEELP